jgi:hypothetical protein
MDLPPTSSDLVRVDHGVSTRQHATGVVRSMAFSPADPEVVYLGGASDL